MRLVSALFLIGCYLPAQEAPVVPQPAAAPSASTPLPVPTTPMGITQVKTAYLLSMRAGFDQYLANNISIAAVLQVVTDPKQADVIITDTLGVNFEKKLAELFPPPEPEVKPAEETEEDTGSQAVPSVKGNDKDRPKSFQSGRGNIFMVDPRAHGVVWSTFVRPKSATTSDLDKAAKEVVKRFAAQIKKVSASQ